MKTILLVRHAKSDRGSFSMSDSARPLNDRGKQDAPVMAKRLLERNMPIDVFLSSPARRAYATASIFVKEFGLNDEKIIVVPELYMAETPAFVQVITNAPAEAETIAIFSHNQGITDFANTLSSVNIDNMPTCSIFAVEAAIDDWKDFKARGNHFLFFDYPKLA